MSTIDNGDFVHSVEADASPRESAMAGAACREVGRPEDGDGDGDDSSYYEYLSENPRKAAETIERLETQVEELKAIRRSQIAEIERLRAGLREDQIEQFARRIQAIAERWKGANGGIYTIRAMALDMAHTLAEERAISVSDGSLKGQDAQRLDPKDDSAVGCKASETPLPDPVAGIVERLKPVAWRRRRKGTVGDGGWIMCPLKPERDHEFELEPLYNATALQSLSQSLASKDAEIERLEEQCAKLATQNALASVDKVLLEDRAEAAEAEIERLTKRLAEECESHRQMARIADTAEARIAEMEKALEPFAEFFDLCERNGYGPATLWAFPEGTLPFGRGSFGSACGYQDLRRARLARQGAKPAARAALSKGGTDE